MNVNTKDSAEKRRSHVITACALVFGLLFHAGTVQAGTEIAIEGYDPVAYFTMLKAVKGKDSITHEWLDRTWHFVSDANKALFAADPITYMPNYGGYCSNDPMNLGHDHKVDPTAWRIVSSKLYLFYTEATANQKVSAEEWAQVKAGLAQ